MATQCCVWRDLVVGEPVGSPVRGARPTDVGGGRVRLMSSHPRDDLPSGESVGFQRTRATKRMGAGAVVRDGDGRVLVVKPTYKTVWELPGGAVEHDESPAAACERELREELGLDLTVGAMLCVDYNAGTEDSVESLMFLFDAGILDDASVAAIRLDPAELVECRFVSVAEALELLDPRVGRRLTAALSSGGTSSVYLEDQAVRRQTL